LPAGKGHQVRRQHAGKVDGPLDRAHRPGEIGILGSRIAQEIQIRLEHEEQVV